ncbi:MAG: redoxin domain-containing protein, partial [Bacteroidales bacterium]|nr:redoxin domain-containing protein [Bacteroidales bacterium]
ELVLSEMIIDDYVLNYFDQIYHRRQSRYLDSIRTTIDRELHVTDPYVLQANKYKIASIQMALNADGGQKVIRDHFDGQPVLYDCLAYMDLFKDLFKNYEMSDEFRDRNPRLAELITLYQLRNAYYMEIPRLRGRVRKQIQVIGEKSRYDETKTMVNHMLERFDRFVPGAPAVDFELNDVEGKTIKLSDYKDQVVVLLFVEGNSRTVSHQLETLAELHRQWQNRVQIVTVTTKDQIALWRRRFEERRYDWPLLNLENNILLLEQYEVHTFPEYFIINKGTKIGMAPAPSPDQTLNDYVESFIGG